jgi:hypothetical protein
MELNTAMRFVMARAQAEAAAAGAKNSTIRIEHVFLGLLKLSELNADDIAPASRHKEQINADIGTVREQLSEQGIDSSRMRHPLRRLLQTKEPPADEMGLEEMLKAAARGQDGYITAAAVLAVILDHLTPLMLQVYPLDKADADEAVKAPDCQQEDDPVQAQALLDLRSEDWEIRKDAIQYVHKEAVLAEVLKRDADWRVRAAVIRYAGWSSELPASAVLHDADWRVRFLAVKRLYNDNSPALAEAAANDARAEVRKVAVVLLRDRSVLSRAALTDEDSGVREAAAAALNRSRSYRFTVTDVCISFSTPEEEKSLQIGLQFEGTYDDSMVSDGWYKLKENISLAKTQTQYLKLKDVFLAGRTNSVYYIRLKPEADDMVEFSVVWCTDMCRVRGCSCYEDWVNGPDRLFDGEGTHGEVYRFCFPYRELLAAAENARIENDCALNTEYYECVTRWEAEDEQWQWVSNQYYVAMNGDEERAKEAVGKLTVQWELANVALRGKAWKARLTAVEAITVQAALAEVALKDKNEKVRKRAVEKLNVQKVLLKIALQDGDCSVGCAAVVRLNNQSALKRVALKASIGSIREEAVRRLTDQPVLAKIALKDEDRSVSCAAVERLHDQRLLIRIALKASIDSTREAAVRRLTDRA